MYAIIASQKYYNIIENTIKELDEVIIYKKVEDEIDIIEELNDLKTNKVPIKKFIIDITTIVNQKNLVSELIKYKIFNDKVQIIIIASEEKYKGKILINELVSKVRINDIILIHGNDDLKEKLLQSIIQPASFIQASRWLLETEVESKKEPVKEKVITVLKDKIIGTVVIGVMGTIDRIGTTHTCISMATFLKNNGYKVGIVELNNSNNFESIKNSYFDVVASIDNFKLNNVTYFPYLETLNLVNVLNSDFNYVILDLGSFPDIELIEFMRANVKIVVSGVKDWEISYLEKFLRETENHSKNSYLFNFSDDENFKTVVENMENLKCYKAPINFNPYSPDKSCQELYEKILKGVLPEKQSNKKQKDNPLKKLFKKKVKS